MRILIIGSGGREHALAWKLAQSDAVEKVYGAPGNPGVACCGECISAGDGSPKALLAAAEAVKADLTVVGGGFGAAAGELVLGPAREAARREAIAPAVVFSSSFTICASDLPLRRTEPLTT